MSLPLIVAGTVEEVGDKLTRIWALIQRRKGVGWPLFQSGEKWLYVTRPDLGHVCPICEAHGKQGIFDGEEVAKTFEHKELWTTNPYVAIPRTHMPDPSKFANTLCRCELHLQNPAEVMEMRLHEEKLAVI